MKTILSHSEEETREIGYRLGKQLHRNQVIYLSGELGAGKTTFIKGLVAGISGFDSEQVNSPTFAYLNIYPGALTVYHFDLYRIRNSDEFLSMGFEEYFESEGVCCIEWSERIADLLPSQAKAIILEHAGSSQRRIQLPEEFEYAI